MKTSLATLFFTAFIASSSGALADGPRSAVILSDAELDRITAGQTTQLMVLLNPGNADVSKTRGASLQCVNCLGVSVEDTIGFKIMVNPVKTIAHCISTKSCGL